MSADSELAHAAFDHVEVRRRNFINIDALSTAGVGAASAAIPLIDSMNPSADVLAVSTTEVDISAIEAGAALVVAYRLAPMGEMP